MSILSKLQKDNASVTPNWELLEEKIDGFVLKPIKPMEDKRGDITEMYNPAWGLSDAPMVYAYQVVVNPKAIRGWELHKKQDDRIFISKGKMRWVLYDIREDSPTYQKLMVLVLSELNRCLMIIPKGVIHAVENVGEDDAIWMNFPTEPYNHADPDKYRLPLKNDLIPFDFDDLRGW